MLFAATKLQVATYLLGVCPFSIAFLVFLNSSVSFVVTDLIERRHKVGDAVGSLGFADELLALIACPFWGLLSDKIGVRYVKSSSSPLCPASHNIQVCVLGYLIIGLALFLFVQAHNVYPQLLLARLFFSLGAAAASTMVTAVLPAVSSSTNAAEVKDDPSSAPAGRAHASSPSSISEVTNTPTSYRANGGSDATKAVTQSFSSTSRVAGLVGMLTGGGALIALLVFLPLPARFQKDGMTPEKALQRSFYIVATAALVLSGWCFLGLRNLQYERERSAVALHEKLSMQDHIRDTWRSLQQALTAGFRQRDIALGYTGGFVARASSVGISLFIPLLVNAMFLSSHLCEEENTPAGLPDIKRRCPRAYVVAAEMTGVCETVALIAAPIFGYVSSRSKRRGLPMMAASLAGVVGYPLFATQFHPDPAEKGKRALAFLAVSLIGVSQIGAIVCSLAVLSNGILSSPNEQGEADDGERQTLLPSADSRVDRASVSDLKGSVAGIYSFYGGAAILILTKVGGLLFDKLSVGAPFYIMGAFNAVLFLACGVLGIQVPG